jgi:hypothetical protein
MKNLTPTSLKSWLLVKTEIWRFKDHKFSCLRSFKSIDFGEALKINFSKIFGIIFSLYLLFHCFFVEAASSGNPASPKVVEEGFFFSSASSFSFRLGYEGIFVPDRKMRKESSSPRSINDFELYLNSGMCTLNILNRLDLFATYGKGKLKINWINVEHSNELYHLKMESNDHSSWSTGTKIIFFEWGNTCFSIGGRYLYFHPSLSYLSKQFLIFPTKKAKIRFKEWQTDLGLSYKADILIPYLCLRYSKAKAHLSINDLFISQEGLTSLKMINRDNVGLALGCSISSGKYFFLNSEVRLFDEEGFTLSGEFKF